MAKEYIRGIILLLGFTAFCLSFPQVAISGGDMIQIPAGWFIMGLDDGEYNEGPAHSVFVDKFEIERYEVSAREFAEFLNEFGNPQYAYFTPDKYSTIVGVVMVNGVAVEERGRPERYMPRPGYEDYPANSVSWYGAAEYCRWKGKRLPTEAQWEKAARGTDERIYPWGNSAPDQQRSRFNRNWNTEGFDVMAPVDSLPDGAAPYGAYNMSGNVWEWVEDYYFQNYCNFCRETDWDYLSYDVFGYIENDPSSNRAIPPKKNPLGPRRGHFRVLRGGSWFDSSGEQVIRTTYRYWLREDERYVHTGFRCASGPPRTRPAYIPLPEPEPEPEPNPEPVIEVTPPEPVEVAAPVSAEPLLKDMGDVFFDFNKYIIKEKYYSLLDEYAEWIIDHPEQSVMLIGHCDSRGRNDYNYSLGLNRALVVRDYFMNKGIEPERIGITSKGKAEPFCPQLTFECWAQNRRTRILAYNPAAAGVFSAFLAEGLDEGDIESLKLDQTAPIPAAEMAEGGVEPEDQKPLPPVELQAPEDITEFRGLVEISFQWDEMEEALSYKFVLARDRLFREVIYTSPLVPDNSYLATFLDYGTYYYKVDVLNRDGEVGSSSDIRSFIIVPGEPQLGYNEDILQ